MVQMSWNLIYRLRCSLRWLWLQEGTPGYKARGLAIGVFCGCFPLFGLQTILGIGLASLFRGNHLLAISGTWISNPFTYLPLYLLNYKVGAAILFDGQIVSPLEVFNWQALWEQGWIFGIRLFLGSLLVGLLGGVMTGLLVYLVLKSRSLKSQ